MHYFIQQFINGLSLGAVYALVAIGYTMVYGIVGMINFAHGEIYMIGSFLAVIGFILSMMLGVDFAPLALILVMLGAVAFSAIYGWAVERLAYRPLRQAPRLAPLISAIGMSIFLQNYVRVTQGADVKSVPPMISGGITLAPGHDFSVEISYTQATIILLTAVLMIGLSWAITRTSFGRAQRASEQDRVMASLLGVNVDRTISLTFALGAGLAGVAGVMLMLRYGSVDFNTGFVAGVKAFTAAVLGGIGSLPGAVLGGLIIGLIEVLFSAYLSIEYKDVAAFSILVLVLIFRPTGLLGRPMVEKV